MYKARNEDRQDCIACYNAKGIPQLMPLPGSHIGDCSDLTECFAFVQCTWQGNWMDGVKTHEYAHIDLKSMTAMRWKQ